MTGLSTAFFVFVFVDSKPSNLTTRIVERREQRKGNSGDRSLNKTMHKTKSDHSASADAQHASMLAEEERPHGLDPYA